MADIRVIVVAENPGEMLVAGCESSGAGLASLTSADRLEIVCDYGPPDRTVQVQQFRTRSKEVRRKLDTKLRLNESGLDQSFRDSAAVTADMPRGKRDEYLESIQNVMLVWREWGEGLSDQLDQIVVSEDSSALDRIEREVTEGPEA
jgi:hypothetical protein